MLESTEEAFEGFGFQFQSKFLSYIRPYVVEPKSTYAKVHDSVSVDALQRKEAEESACGKVHDPTLEFIEIYFQEKSLCNFLVKNGNY